MNWQIIVGIAMLYQYALVPVATKKIGAVEGSRTRKLTLMYLFQIGMALLAVMTTIIVGDFRWSHFLIIVAIIGVGNSFGCYCYWRSLDISMSKTSMMNNMDDLIAIGLGFLILGEGNALTPVLSAGIVVSLICVTVFIAVRNKKNDVPLTKHLVKWVLGYSIIWGIAMFSMRFFSTKGLIMPAFIAAYYVGSLFGAFLTRAIMGKKEEGLPLTLDQKKGVFLLAFANWSCLMFTYWIRELVPIAVIQPIQLVAEMSIPTIIGLLIFREARTMSRTEILVIIGGIVGVALIAFGF